MLKYYVREERIRSGTQYQDFEEYMSLHSTWYHHNSVWAAWKCQKQTLLTILVLNHWRKSDSAPGIAPGAWIRREIAYAHLREHRICLAGPLNIKIGGLRTMVILSRNLAGFFTKSIFSVSQAPGFTIVYHNYGKLWLKSTGVTNFSGNRNPHHNFAYHSPNLASR